MNSKIRIEMPNTDAYMVFENIEDLYSFLAEHDNPEVQYDHEYGVWRVRAFAESREKYSEMKAEDCARWGCE